MDELLEALCRCGREVKGENPPPLKNLITCSVNKLWMKIDRLAPFNESSGALVGKLALLAKCRVDENSLFGEILSFE